MSANNLTLKKKQALKGSACLLVILALSGCARVPKPDLMTTSSIQNNAIPFNLVEEEVTDKPKKPTFADMIKNAGAKKRDRLAAKKKKQSFQIISDPDSKAILLMDGPPLVENAVEITAIPAIEPILLADDIPAIAENSTIIQAPRDVAVLKVKSVENTTEIAVEAEDNTQKKPTLFSWFNKKRVAKTARLETTDTKNTVNKTSKKTRKGKIKAEPEKQTLFGMFKRKKTGKLPSNIDPIETASISESDVKPESKTANINLDDPMTSSKKGKNGTMSLYQVVKKTLETNPEVGIALARERDATAAVRIERSDYYPSVDFEMSSGLENTFGETKNELAVNRTDANIQLNQKVFDFGITKSKIERREKLEESARLRRIDKSEEIAFNVVQAYLEVLKQSDLADTAKRNVKAHEKMSKLVEISEKEGNASLADVKRVQTRLDAAKSAVLDIENGLKSAIGAFKRITDINPDKLKRPKTISAKLGKVGKDEIPSVARANFELRALASDRDSLDLQFKQQFGQRYPEFFLSAQANYKNNNSGETGKSVDMRGMLGMRYRLFDGGKRRATERQIDARMLEAELSYQQKYRELVETLDENAQAIKSSEEKSQFLADSVAAARKVVSLYTEQFKVAEKSPFELLDAQQDLYNAEREMITNKFDAANATFNNLKLRGTLIHYLLK